MTENVPWIRSLIALSITVAVLVGGTAIVYGISREKTSAYAEHVERLKARDAWYGQRKLRPEQVQFDEVLAGRIPVDRLATPELRTLAAGVRAMALGESDVNHRVRFLASLFLDEGSNNGVVRWIRCAGTTTNCGMEPDVVSLGNPERLGILLGSDEAAKRAVLPEVPEEFRHRPAWNGDRTHDWLLSEALDASPPAWLWIAAWAVTTSLFVGLLFLLTSRRADARHPNPFVRLPRSVVGGAAFLVLSPGILLMHGLRLLTWDVPNAFRAAKRKLFGRTFESEHERILDELSRMEARASERDGNKDVVDLIRLVTEKVRGAENAAELEKLRTVAEDVLASYEAQEEIRKLIA